MASSIEDALKNARYNEAVVVTVSNEDCHEERREIVLVAALDQTNGGVSWQDAATQPSSQNADEIDVGIQRHLRTKKWVFPMLNDVNRNTLYASSISKACMAAVQNLKSNQERKIDSKIRVLDIGSGTGLLAMLASSSMEETSGVKPEVTGIEMASAMARLARKTITSNGLDKNINIIEGHSCEETFAPYADGNKAILCTSELLESGLLGEGIIPALRDAWDRHLADDAIVVPQRARVYAQVLEGRSCINNYRGPDYDSSRVCLSTSSDGKDSLLGGKGGVIVPIHAGSLLGETDLEFLIGCAPADDARMDCAKPLSAKTLVLEFDFTSKESIPPPSGRTIELELTALTSGTAHGVLFWWELDLWEGQTYSTELGKSPWQDHWQQCLFVFGSDHEDCEALTEGQPFTLITSHDDTCISFDIAPRAPASTSEQPSKKQRLDKDDVVTFNKHISYDRALQLNDKDRMDVLHAAIQTAIEIKGKSSCIIDLSDFSLCSLIAAKAYGAEKVTSVESSMNGVPMLSAIVAQLGNNLPSEGREFQVINAHPENLSADIIGGQADIVMAEPYYEILEGWHLQEALNYFYLLRSMKKRGIIKSDAVSVPSYASIKACAVQFDDSVVKAHCGLREPSICGFSHEDVSQYGHFFSTHDMKLPLVQYKWKRLSDDFTIAKLAYDGSVEAMTINGDGEWTDTALKNGECHGIVLWVEYGMRVKKERDEKEAFSTITTGNRYHQQAFRFLKCPTAVKEGSHICVKPVFHTSSLEDHEIELKIKSKY